jgi:hypothetical protein
MEKAVLHECKVVEESGRVVRQGLDVVRDDSFCSYATEIKPVLQRKQI